MAATTSGVAQDRRADAARQVADLGDRRQQLRPCHLDQRVLAGVRPRSWSRRRASATRRCCAPSWRSRSIRPRSASAASTIREPRRPDLLELGTDLGRQAFVGEREPRDRADRLDATRVLPLDRRVVVEHREQLAVALQTPGGSPSGHRQRVHGRPSARTSPCPTAQGTPARATRPRARGQVPPRARPSGTPRPSSTARSATPALASRARTSPSR